MARKRPKKKNYLQLDKAKEDIKEGNQMLKKIEKWQRQRDKKKKERKESEKRKMKREKIKNKINI